MKILLTVLLAIITLLQPQCSKPNGSTYHPVPDFTFSPDTGTYNTMFIFDAGISSHEKYENKELLFRWDFNNDQIWDTDWASAEVASTKIHYSRQVHLKVKDPDGETAECVKNLNFTFPDGMKYIPSGTFNMGTYEEWLVNPKPDELPLHPVYLSPFYMDSTEITRAHFKKYFPDYIYDESERAAGYITVNQIWDFCNLRSKAEGLDTVYDSWGNADFSKNGYRLPTEAEWEYACKAGQESFYYFNLFFYDEYAWTSASNTQTPAIVAQLKPNDFGLYDIIGNVGELVNDWWNSTYYQNSPLENPTGPNSGTYYLWRGGSYLNSINSCNCTGRWMRGNTGGREYSFGFRCVLPVRDF